MIFLFYGNCDNRYLIVLKHSFPTRRSSERLENTGLAQFDEVQDLVVDTSGDRCRDDGFEDGFGQLLTADLDRYLDAGSLLVEKDGRSVGHFQRDRKSTRLNSSH